MKYVILLYTNPASRDLWAGMSDADRVAGLGVYAQLNADLVASGEYVDSQSLDDPTETRTVLVRDGVAMATDGPFAEVKEHLAGFYVVDVASLDRAVEIVARIPEAAHGVVEVRPVRDLAGYL
ncbi:MAG TPA: YciI family protein [Pseudonocardiaceae bacterium]